MSAEAAQKSASITPDTYHIPGYGGFCPQFKYRIEQTFGQTTSRLLRDVGVASSGHLVLANTQPNVSGSAEEGKLKAAKLRTYTHSWGDRKLTEKMVPGYAGFIPRSQHFFGKSYAKNSTNAITDFKEEQHESIRRLQELHRSGVIQNGNVPRPENSERLPVINTQHMAGRSYISKSAPQHTLTPYFTRDDNSEKFFISGYMGFVPRSRDLQRRSGQAPRDVMTIYPGETGLIPRYTGHIPGEKYRYGNTFGHSTKNLVTRPTGVVASIA